jgi:hypothetical protein
MAGRWRVGDRVVVRYRRPAPEPGEPPLSDALGELVQADENTLTVRTRQGDVTIEAAAVVAGKRVPPPPEPGRRSDAGP